VNELPPGSTSELRPTQEKEISSLAVDSAISHCEKLRRVVELEEWIREACDSSILAAASERWRAERERLVAELALFTGN